MTANCSTNIVWKYDVFLSFRGIDTRNTFTGVLYAELERESINAYKDDIKLPRGKDIGPELLEAINESRFAVAIISNDYTSSGWCLSELVEIAKCRKEKGLTLLAVFDHVEPSHLLNLEQENHFAQAFRENVARDNLDKEAQWRTALSEIAGVNPHWILKDRDHSEVIKEIVRTISDTVKSTFISTKKNVIGIDSRLIKLELRLDVGSGGIRTIGICGSRGIGKTTIAVEVFERIHRQFEIKAFFSNVSYQYEEHGSLMRLQEHLFEILFDDRKVIQYSHEGKGLLMSRLCSTKALIILDNVDDLDQIENLVGKVREQQEWFGQGSRIIITTRDASLLKKYGVSNIYEVEKLTHDEALELFCLRAFKQNSPREGYEDMSRDFVKLADGLPSYLDDLGSFLSGIENTDEWSDELKRRTSKLNKESAGRKYNSKPV